MTSLQNAAALVNQHLSDRAAGIIKGRVCATGVTVFEVQGSEPIPYVVTVSGINAPVTTCTCKGFAHRHTCKHTAAVAALMGQTAETPVPVAPARPRRPRSEWVEEI